MRRLKYILIMVVALCKASYSFELEEGNLELKVNGLSDPFFMLYIDEIKEEGYLPLKSFFDFVDLPPLTIDERNQRVTGKLPDGKEIRWNFQDEKGFFRDGDYYINSLYLEELFPVRRVEFNLGKLYLDIRLDFKTPKELIDEQNRRRGSISKREKGEKELYIASEKKLFTPGVVKAKYLRRNFQKGNDNAVQVGYASQILYGEFNTTINVYDGSESSNKETIENISLGYNNFLSGKDLTLGNFYMRTPSLYRNSSKMIGASLLGTGAKTGIYERGDNSFEGFAPEGAVVELYRNGLLLDFQVVSGQRYFFTGIDSLSLTDNYSIRVYKGDGSFTEENLSLLMNDRNLRRNSWDYQLQVGEAYGSSEREKEINYTGQISYGVTNNITYEAGIYNISGRYKDSNSYEDISHSLYISSPPIKFPFQTKVTWYDESDAQNSKDGTVTVEHKQRVFGALLEAQYEDYSKKKSLENGKDATGKLILKKSFGKLGTGAGYSYETFGERKVMGYSTGLNYSLRFMTLSGEYEFKEYNYSNQDKHRIKLSSAITKFKAVNIMLDATQEFTREWERQSQNYGVKFVKRHNQYYGDKVYDFSVGFNYSDRNRDRFKAEISSIIYLDSIRNPFTSSKVSISANSRDIENHRVGLELEKTIALEDITRNSKMKNVSNAWISGKVFIDENYNGVYDEGEETVEGVQLTASGKRVLTDEKGDYFIEDISPNRVITLDINSSEIDPLLRFENRQKYKLNPASGRKIDVPLQYAEYLEGNITIVDENLEEERKPHIYNRVQITLYKDGEEQKNVRPEFDGFFMLDDITPGIYIIEAQYRGQDKGYVVENGKQEIVITPEELLRGKIDKVSFILIPVEVERANETEENETEI